jgi:hypothetical protein
MKALILLPAIVAGIYYWYTKHVRIHALSKKRRPTDKQTIQKQKVTTPDYRCVVIEPGSGACQSAKQLESKQILMNDAETLPLKSCDATTCSCGYIRYDDRRNEARRRDISGAEYFTAYRKNRRDSNDRRKKTA